MLRITKIFHFETAHAIYEYHGACKNIHGHSYQLEVSVESMDEKGISFISGMGFVIDFKDLKRIVLGLINETFDHKLILSKKFMEAHPVSGDYENLVIWEVEPSAENMIIYLSRKLKNAFPSNVKLVALKLFETEDSFGEWVS